MIRLTSIVCLFVSGIQCYEFSSKREIVKSLSWKSNYNADYHAIGGGCPQKLLFVPLPSTLPPNFVSALQSIQELLEATINTTTVPGASISITYIRPAHIRSRLASRRQNLSQQPSRPASLSQRA